MSGEILDAARTTPLTGGPTFSLGNRMRRAIWAVTWRLLGTWTPVPLHGWRRFLLRLFGAQLAATARIYPGVSVWYPPHLTMAERATLGPGVICYCMAPVTLEPYALVSQRAHLCTGTHAIDDANFQLYAEPITLGARSWVAAEAFVGPGVTLEEGAVLGARGVATRDLEPWTVYAGNPARKLRQRQRPNG
ncbi:MAG: putative colanic acid biosynthesis acetyltransferase [Devosia sp.]